MNDTSVPHSLKENRLNYALAPPEKLGVKCPQSTAYMHPILWFIEEDLGCLQKNWDQGEFHSHKEE